MVLQLLGILLLTQPWFTISMKLNGELTQLGDYEATAAYAIAMPAALLSGAAVVVALLLTNLPKRLTLALNAVVLTGSAVWMALQVVAKNVSGLDGQLDRLTGIAKTHGVGGLNIGVAATPWFWLAVTLLAAVASGFLSVNRSGWAGPSTKDAERKKTKAPIDPIDLWEQQRD